MREGTIGSISGISRIGANNCLSTAAERLADAETTASNDQHKAQREGKAFRSNIYDAGSEFALCHAQAQLMIAVVGVLNESLTESLRGFYKMRKAFFTLESLLEMENRHIKNRKSIGQSGSTKHSSESLRSTYSVVSEKAMPVGFAERNKEQSSIQSRPDTSSPLHNAIIPGDIKEAVEEKTDSIDATSGDEEDEFFDADDAIDDLPVAKTYTGHMDVGAVNGKLSDLSIAAEDHAKKGFSMSSPQPPPRTGTGLMLLDSGPESEVFSNPLDMFIHSGSNLCFGLMLLLISMIPPAFGKLLYIIGFKGDRERGIRMLWQASKFDNVNGGMAGLILLGWYNGLVGFCDIVPDSTGEVDDVEGYPAGRLGALLHEMRTRYPKSYLWLLEEARMNAQHRNLDTALEILSRENKSQLKQVAALHMFEKSLNSMYSHRYALCSESFLRVRPRCFTSIHIFNILFSVLSSTPGPELCTTTMLVLLTLHSTAFFATSIRRMRPDMPNWRNRTSVPHRLTQAKRRSWPASYPSTSLSTVKFRNGTLEQSSSLALLWMQWEWLQ